MSLADFFRSGYESCSGSPVARPEAAVFPRYSATILLSLILIAGTGWGCAASDEKWHEELARAKERAKAFRDNAIAESRRRQIERPVPDAHERAVGASREALSDSTLQPGDIVSTTDGLLVFKGQTGDERSPDNFRRLEAD